VKSPKQFAVRASRRNARGSSPIHARKTCRRRSSSGSNNGRTLARDQRLDDETFEDLHSPSHFLDSARTLACQLPKWVRTAAMFGTTVVMERSPYRSAAMIS
jgi:hypothetical protein